MKRLFSAVGLILLLAACGEDQQAAAPPPPLTLDREAVGHYCGMTVADHEGPKGQIHVAGRAEPYWFTSVRDTVAFTLLPEEPKDIRAIYVSDMAASDEWAQPSAWIDARQAVFVLDSDMRGGMGQREAVPFSDRAAAERFTTDHGGTIVAFDAIPRSYILDEEAPQKSAPAAHDSGH